MAATDFNDSEASATAVDAVLSDDAYKREVELAFLERLVIQAELRSTVQLNAARAHKRVDLARDVLQVLHHVRSPVWKSLARQLEKEQPPKRDFGRFGKFRDSDR